MINKNQYIRHFIYITFCTLIVIVGMALTYYLFTNEDFKFENKVDSDQIIFGDESIDDCSDDEASFYFGSLFFKFSAAFIAGSIMSDKFFIKLGAI